MIAELRQSGAPEALLPVRGEKEACYAVRESDGRFFVTLMERANTQDIAEFPNEMSAVDFIYDLEVITFRLNGDTRFDKWNANPKAFPLPRAEDFGGRTLQG